MSTKLDPFFRDAGLFIFRLVLGFLFVMHGWQNAVTKGWGSTRDSFAAMNIPATDIAATLASWGELITGVLLIVGLLTRLSSLVLVIDMAGAQGRRAVEQRWRLRIRPRFGRVRTSSSLDRSRRGQRR